LSLAERATAEVVAAVTRAAGRAPAEWQRVVGGGYTPAERWVVEFGDGGRAFAKVGIVASTGEWLRVEHRAYRDVAAPFMPRMLGWSDEPVPALLLEDLSAARWPPPWDRSLVDRMLLTLDAVAATPCPDWAPPISELTDIFSGWSQVSADPEPFLSLGLASRGWLETALPELVASERPMELEGSALLHADVRSDNMCFTADRALLVDWNFIGRGNPLFDVAAWLPSLAHEGGPMPEEVRPEAGVFAAAIAGYMCARAGLPVIPEAPHVRRVQLEQAATSLPWAARWLGLPQPDGPRLALGC
jgi:Phosphotransferase enzyme family